MKLAKYDVKPNALLGEVVGTFILTLIAVTVANPIIVGFVLVVLVLALFATSGTHLNPAISFGLWSVRKINFVKMLFYWAMQFAGAFLALMVIQMYQGGGFGISFASFGEFDVKIVMAELLATAVFAFAVSAGIRKDFTESARSLAIGLGLLTGLAVGGGLVGQAVQNMSLSASQETSRITKVDGVTANPAVALAATEKADQQNALSQLGTNQQTNEAEKRASSRLGLEVIVGTLFGAALGMNLYHVMVGENPFQKKKTVGAKVTAVVKKGKKQVKKTVKKAKK